MVIELRRLAHADINLLRGLRNASADSFFDSHQITAEEQESWWFRYEKRLNGNGANPIGVAVFYTIWVNGVTPVGFLSTKLLAIHGWGSVVVYDRELGNLLLAPAYRGQGIMDAAITEVRRLYSPLTFWVAHVKAGNTASLNLFARQEFVQLEPNTVGESTQAVSSAKGYR